MWKYYIVLLDFDQDVLDILEYTNEKDYQLAIQQYQEEFNNKNYYSRERTWFSFEPFSKEI